jgi:hypothetical protein
MNNDTTNSEKQHTLAGNILVLKTNVLHSGMGGGGRGLRMRTTSLAYRAAYVTGIYLALADRTYRPFFGVIVTMFRALKSYQLHSRCQLPPYLNAAQVFFFPDNVTAERWKKYFKSDK